MKNLFAYTANTRPYPEFASLNKHTDGSVRLTVRSPAGPGQFSDKDSGATAEIVLPRDKLLALFEALRDELTPPMMKATGQSI